MKYANYFCIYFDAVLQLYTSLLHIIPTLLPGGPGSPAGPGGPSAPGVPWGQMDQSEVGEGALLQISHILPRCPSPSIGAVQSRRPWGSWLAVTTLER